MTIVPQASYPGSDLYRSILQVMHPTGWFLSCLQVGQVIVFSKKTIRTGLAEIVTTFG